MPSFRHQNISPVFFPAKPYVPYLQMTCDRATRLFELQHELAALSAKGKGTSLFTPARDAVLERRVPVYAAVMALKEELAV